jgi:curved DNA-binding protein CbpA
VTAPTDGRTWYQVMGLTASATAPEIRSAYLRLARNLHPDRHASGSATERQLADRRMREVNAAWAVLGDESAKSMYDTELRLAEHREASAARPSTPSTASRSPERPAGSRPVHHRYDGVPIDDGEPDEVELTRGQAFLLRRVPVLVAIAIALGIFIGSAYAGVHEDVPSSTTTTTLVGGFPIDAMDD